MLEKITNALSGHIWLTVAVLLSLPGGAAYLIDCMKNGYFPALSISELFVVFLILSLAMILPAIILLYVVNISSHIWCWLFGKLNFRRIKLGSYIAILQAGYILSFLYGALIYKNTLQSLKSGSVDEFANVFFIVFLILLAVWAMVVTHNLVSHKSFFSLFKGLLKVTFFIFMMLFVTLFFLLYVVGFNSKDIYNFDSSWLDGYILILCSYGVLSNFFNYSYDRVGFYVNSLEKESFGVSVDGRFGFKTFSSAIFLALFYIALLGTYHNRVFDHLFRFGGVGVTVTLENDKCLSFSDSLGSKFYSDYCKAEEVMVISSLGKEYLFEKSGSVTVVSKDDVLSVTKTVNK